MPSRVPDSVTFAARRCRRTIMLEHMLLAVEIVGLGFRDRRLQFVPAFRQPVGPRDVAGACSRAAPRSTTGRAHGG